MKTENNQENLTGGQQSGPRGGAVGVNRAKSADFAKDSEVAVARNEALGDDRSKVANASNAPESVCACGGAVSDDRSKSFGPEKYVKG